VSTWTDHTGRTWRVSESRHPLNPARRSGHAALRAFVFIRDDFACRHCGLKFGSPSNYDGRCAIGYCVEELDLVFLHVDHVIPRAAGGSHHPDNLQALCSTCNSKKACSDKAAASAYRRAS